MYYAVVLFISALLFGTSYSQTLYVSPTATTTNVDCTLSLPCTLEAALIHLHNNTNGAGGTNTIIELASGIYTGDSYRGLFVDAKNVQITGTGSSSTIFDLEHTNRALSIVNKANVSISGVTFKNGEAQPFRSFSAYGGVFLTFDASLTLSDVRMLNNSAPGFLFDGLGGAVWAQDTILSLENTEIIDNTAGLGGGFYSTGANVGEMRNVTFRRNRVRNGGWAGGFIPEGTSKWVIFDSLFEENVAEFGGAIDDGDSADTRIVNSVFRGNIGITDGGAYFAFSATKMVFENCLFYNNSAVSGGGARITSSTDVSFFNCTFDSCVSNQGGAVTLNSDQPTILTNCTIRNCSANLWGGGVVYGGTGDAIFTNVIFEENTSQGPAAGLYLGGSLALLNNCTLRNNVARLAGAGVYALTGTASVTGSLFIGNNAFNGAGAACESGALNITSSVFRQNIASRNGGGFGAVSSCTAFLESITFEENTARRGGGAYRDLFTSVQMKDMLFKNNTAYRGGGYYIDTLLTCSVPVQTGVVFEFNSATSGGGSLWVESPEGECYDSFENAVFRNNSGLYGNKYASPPYSIAVTSVPDGVAPSEPFQIVVEARDYYNNTVFGSSDILMSLDLAENDQNATITGLRSVEVSSGGTAVFKGLILAGKPGSTLTLNVVSDPATKLTTTDITLAPCDDSTLLYEDRFCLTELKIATGSRIFIALVALAAVINVLVLIVLVVIYRHSIVIKYSSFTFCLLVLFGSLILILSVTLWLPDVASWVCPARVWSALLGFSVMYGALFMKGVRIWRMLKSGDKLRVVTFSTFQLVLALGGVIVPVIIVLLIWQFVGSYSAVTTVDILDLTTTTRCRVGQLAFPWLLVLYCLCILSCCVFIAWVSHKYPANHNESRSVFIAIAGVAFIAVIIIPLLSVSDNMNIEFFSLTLATILTTILSVNIIFIQKFIETYREKNIENRLMKKIDTLKDNLLVLERQLYYIQNEDDDGFQIPKGNAAGPAPKGKTVVLKKKNEKEEKIQNSSSDKKKEWLPRSRRDSAKIDYVWQRTNSRRSHFGIHSDDDLIAEKGGDDEEEEPQTDNDDDYFYDSNKTKESDSTTGDEDTVELTTTRKKPERKKSRNSKKTATPSPSRPRRKKGSTSTKKKPKKVASSSQRRSQSTRQKSTTVNQKKLRKKLSMK